MRTLNLAAAALLMGLLSPARAENAALLTATPPCDYFENALIGTRCAGTFAIGAGLRSVQQKLEAHGTNFSYVGKSDWLTPFEYVRVTPTSWLTLGFTSEFTDFNFSGRSQIIPGSVYTGRYGRASFDHQNFVANVNLIDTGPAASRYVINLIAGDSFVPAQDHFDSNNRVFVGYNASAKWRLGQSNNSLNWRSSLEADFNTASDFVVMYPASSLLLSDDVLGIGFGPVLSSSHIVSGGNSLIITDIYRAGAEIVAQPFKGSSNIFLAGLVLDASVARSLGNAGAPSAIDLRETVVSGSMRYNFKY